MKRIILIIIISVMLSLFLFLSFNIYKYVKDYKFGQINYDDYLGVYQYRLIAKLLSGIGFKVKSTIFPIKKEKYKVVILMNDFSIKQLNTWKEWAKSGNRLIVFFDNISGIDNEILLDKNGSGEEIIDVQEQNEYTKNVKKLKVFYKTHIDTDNRSIFDKNDTLILSDNNYKIAVEQKIGDGSIIYLNNSFMFSDKLILENDNALFLNNLLEDYSSYTIILDFNEYIEKNKTSISKTPGLFEISIFPYLLIQFFIILIIFILANIKRFGLAIDKSLFKRRSLNTHLEAVGYFYEKSKDIKVMTNILDNYFVYRLNKLTKLSKKDIINEVKNRYNISDEDLIIFETGSKKNIIEREQKREKFIKKFKGL